MAAPNPRNGSRYSSSTRCLPAGSSTPSLVLRHRPAKEDVAHVPQTQITVASLRPGPFLPEHVSRPLATAAQHDFEVGLENIGNVPQQRRIGFESGDLVARDGGENIAL